MKKLLAFLLVFLLAGRVYAQSSPAFDPNVYLPTIGNGIDTIQGHDTTGHFGAGIINLGPAPGEPFGRIAMQGIPGNEANLTTIHTGHDFDLRRLKEIKKLNLSLGYHIDHQGHLRAPNTTDLVVDDGNLVPKIYWGDSLGNFDSARFTNLRPPPNDTRFKFWDVASGAYCAMLTTDSVEDIVWLVVGADSTAGYDVFMFFFHGGSRLFDKGHAAYPDTVIRFGVDPKPLSRRFSQGDWRGVGREDLIAVEKDGGSWHYYRNDPPFRLDSFAHALLYDTLLSAREHPDYSGMFENQQSIRALPKAAGDRSVDFMPAVKLSTEHNPVIHIFRGGPDFGSHKLRLDSAEGKIHAPDFYDSQLNGLNGDDGFQATGDMTGTGYPVILTGGGIGSGALNFFYVLGKCVDTGMKVAAFYNDDFASSQDSLTADQDGLEDMLMGIPLKSDLLLFRGSSKIPIRRNPRYGVNQEARLGEEPLQLYPNPARTTTTLTFDSRRAEPATITIRDVLGREMFRETINLRPGMQEIALLLRDLANGTYVIQIQSASLHLTNRVEILR